MSDADIRDESTKQEWSPKAVTLGPQNSWPPNPQKLFKWLFGFPGYLWPENLLLLGITLATWTFLTPDLSTMQSFQVWWIALIFARNIALILILYGGAHLYFYVYKCQGDTSKFTKQPLATNSSRFRFKSQVLDNMFHTLAIGVPVFTGYEVISYWAFANGYLGFIDFGGDPVLFWGWFGLLLFVAPMIHAVVFYFVHRFLHTKTMYKAVHSLHHRNVVVGPWSGLDMHLVEHLLYFSTVVVQWLLALHPVNALFQIQIAAIYPITGHLGYEKLIIDGKEKFDFDGYFHYLHHKFFECNYGTGVIALDKLFGTFHDGSKESQIVLRDQIRAKRKATA